MGSESEGVVEPSLALTSARGLGAGVKRQRIRCRQSSNLTGCTTKKPGGKHRPKDASHGSWERRNPPWPSVG